MENLDAGINAGFREMIVSTIADLRRVHGDVDFEAMCNKFSATLMPLLDDLEMTVVTLQEQHLARCHVRNKYANK